MRKAVPWLIAGAGAVLVVAGVVVFAAANRGPADFGWSSYAPLQETQTASLSAVTFSDGSVLWTGEHLVGAGLLVLGLLVLTAALAWLLGRRAGRRESPPATSGVSDRRRVAISDRGRPLKRYRNECGHNHR